MIRNKRDYLYYLECDRVALRESGKWYHRFTNTIWTYERMLRKIEYRINTGKPFFITKLYMLKYERLGRKLGFEIPVNVVGPGLSIAHVGTVIINGNAKVGDNCRIQTGVTIGSTNGSKKAPIIGDNVFLGDGCKIIGNIKIADGVAVGANAVVVKDIIEQNTSWGGVPARKLSDHGAGDNVVRATEIILEES